MKKTKFLLGILLSFAFVKLHAQTPQENLEKYWKYRDRFRKDFVKIGKNPGESIPIAARSIGGAYNGAPADPVTNLVPSRLYTQDATVHFGHYMAVLGTEYKLLNSRFQEANNEEEEVEISKLMDDTKTEIYYALLTLERLDLYAESTLSGDPSDLSADDMNGVTLRDDVPVNFYEYFQNDYSLAFNRPADFISFHSDLHPVEYWGKPGLPPGSQPTDVINLGNFTTLDQLTSVLTGLMCIYDFLPSENHQPNMEGPINLKEKARRLALTALNNFMQVTTCGEENVQSWVQNQISGTNSVSGHCRLFKIRDWKGLLGRSGLDLTYAAPQLIEIAKHFHSPMFFGMSTSEENEIIVPLMYDPEKLKLKLLESNMEWFPCKYELLDLCELKIQLGEPITFGTIPLTSLKMILQECENQNINLSTERNPCINFSPALAFAASSINFNIEGVLCDNITATAVILGIPLEMAITAVALPITYVVSLMSKKVGDAIDEFYASVGAAYYTAMESLAQNGGSICPRDFFDCPDRDLKMDEDNAHIMCELATLSGIWDRSYVGMIAEKSDMDWYNLLYSVLHGNSPYTTSSLDDRRVLLLNTAPCVGPWDDPARMEEAPPSGSAAIGWLSENRLFHVHDASQHDYYEGGDTDCTSKSIYGHPDASFRGEFSGLDYMLYYNLNKLCSFDPLWDYTRTQTCNCVVEITFDVQREEQLLVNRKFEDYREKGIPIEAYLAHDFTMSGADAIMDVKNDLIICTPSGALTTTLVIENNAQLNLYEGNFIRVKPYNKLIIRNGATLNTGYPDGNCCAGKTYIYLEHDAELNIEDANFNAGSGFELVMAQDAKFIVNGSEVNFLAGGEVSKVSADAAIISFDNSSIELENGSQYMIWNLENYSMFDVTASSVNLRNSRMTFHNHANSNIENSSFFLSHGFIECSKHSDLILLDSDGDFYDSHLSFTDISNFNHQNSYINIESNSFIVIGAPGDVIYSEYLYNGGEVKLNGPDCRLIFEMGKLHIGQDLTFQPTFGSYGSGFLEFRVGGTRKLINEPGSIFKLVGHDSNDLMLKIVDWAELSNLNFGQGEIILRNCKVDLSNNGHIMTDMAFTTHLVRFVDESTNFVDHTSALEIWHTNDCSIGLTTFADVTLRSTNSEVFISSSNFNGFYSQIIANEGKYSITNSNFHDSFIQSQDLEALSTISNCDFSELGTDDYALINDVSLAEIRIEQCSFTNSSRGISKENGLLTLKCDDFENIQFSAVEVLNCGLNMSSNSNAGFNVFTDVGTCLNLNNATLLNLENGVNDFSGASDNVISGTLDISCDSECGAELIATNNYWGEDPIYQPYYYNPSSSAVHIDLLTSYESGVLCGGGFGNTGQCEVTLLDEEPAMPLGCDITYLPVSGIVRSMNTTPSDDEFLATQNQVASISDMASTDLTGADAKTFEGWILFPNPVKDVLSVSCSFGGVWDCAMYDLVGQLVQSDLQNFTPSATIQLNVSSLIPGYYFVEFNNGIQSHRFKFVKE